MSSLAFTDLGVRYGRRDAIQGFTDTVRPGEWLCLIGPNGAGKSSILRATAGLVPHTGTIAVDGAPIANFTPIGASGFSVARISLSNAGDGNHLFDLTSNRALRELLDDDRSLDQIR